MIIQLMVSSKIVKVSPTRYLGTCVGSCTSSSPSEQRLSLAGASKLTEEALIGDNKESTVFKVVVRAEILPRDFFQTLGNY